MNILAKDIIAEWDLTSLPQSKQSEMLNRIGRIMYQAILVRSLDVLAKEDQDELDLLLDKDDTTPEDTLRFLKEKIPNFEKLVAEERKNLKEDLIVK